MSDKCINLIKIKVFGSKITKKDCYVYRLVRSYCFRENYYFMAVDRVTSSRDSRYWRLLPESYIVGVATLVWKSENMETGKIRWSRVLKAIE